MKLNVKMWALLEPDGKKVAHNYEDSLITEKRSYALSQQRLMVSMAKKSPCGTYACHSADWWEACTIKPVMIVIPKPARKTRDRKMNHPILGRVSKRELALAYSEPGPG